MNIAIWGLGVSGIAALKLLVQQNEHQLFVVDQQPPSEEVLELVREDQCYLQSEFVELRPALDLIVLSPGVDPRIKPLQEFSGVEIISEIELAFRFLAKPAPIIAVTGTNGKTTTVTLIDLALKQAGFKVFLGGNIGTAFSDLVVADEKVDYIVLELSSFQLEKIDQFKAHIGCILNITPSHMERYDSFEQYQQAKINLLRHSEIKIADKEYIENVELLAPIKNYDWSSTVLKGKHYLQNFTFVEKVLQALKIDSAAEIVQKLINEFQGVKYRLQFEREIGGVRYYNDAKSTNLAALIGAIESFEGESLLLLMGGKKRNDFLDLSCLKNYPQIKKIFAFGESALEIYNQHEDLCETFNDLEAALKASQTVAVENVLLSPAYPSFDQFRNYQDRGRCFSDLVNALDF